MPVLSGCWCWVGRRKGKMEQTKVPLERAIHSHCPTAGLDPNTSSRAKFLMHIMHIIVIYISIYYLIIHFQVCFGQDFSLLNPSAMGRGVISASPNPSPRSASGVCPTEQRQGQEGMRITFSCCLHGHTCAGQQGPHVPHVPAVVVGCPHAWQTVLERDSRVLNKICSFGSWNGDTVTGWHVITYYM